VDAYLAISHIHDRLEKSQQHPLHVHHIPITGHGPMIHPHPAPLDVPPDDLGEEGQQLLSALRGCSDDGIVRLEEVVLEVDERLTESELVDLDVIFAPAFGVQEVRLVDRGLHRARSVMSAWKKVNGTMTLRRH
jgi:hypothetical protein